MIQDFDTVKQQLGELAGVINSFKSEAAQLRIIEFVLGGAVGAERHAPSVEGTPPSKKTSHRRKARAKTSDGEKPKAKRKVSSGTSASATLTQLAEGDFFKTPRTIRAIIEHCRNNLARSFKQNEFSGKLGQMVRKEELTREKNANNQYEYKKA